MTDPNPNPNPGLQGRDYEKELAETRAEAAARRINEQKEKEAREKAEKDLADERAAKEKALKDKDTDYTAKLEKTNKRVIDSEIKAIAVANGLKDTDLLPLIKRDGITMDDDGNITGIEEAITAFREAKPDYFDKRKGERQDGQQQQQSEPKKPIGNNINPPKADPNPAPKNSRAMTSEEYRAHKKKVLEDLKKAG